MDKEVVVHLYNGILLSHKKEQTWVNCSEVKSKSEREKPVSYSNAFMWNWEIRTDEPRTELYIFFIKIILWFRCYEELAFNNAGKRKLVCIFKLKNTDF